VKGYVRGKTSKANTKYFIRVFKFVRAICQNINFILVESGKCY